MLLGVDVGGTFTDFVLLHGGRLITHKVLSTPENPAVGFLQGMRELEVGPACQTVVHGSTVATNAVLERKGPRTALITTRGFRDVLEIGRQTRPKLYDLMVERPAPIVEPSLRFEVDERVDYTGAVLQRLDVEEVERVLDLLGDSAVESVAVCLLFSFLNPEHEMIVESRARKRGFFVSSSYEILPEYREYERTSTVTINAYVSPLLGRYVSDVETGLAEMGCRSLRIMQSNGGSITAATAKAAAVRTLLSGPAAGVVGGFFVASAAGYGDIITFDMGGTSTDVSLCPSRILETTESLIGGLPAKIPMIDIHTVGAGGGSIARMDAGGALRVGPRSAGSDPGPVCYGRGEEIAVTDANLILGRLQPEYFLGGRMRLDLEGARQKMAELAAQMGTDIVETARGIISVANSNMEKAIRVVSVERGFDPRSFTLVAFGGAGPLHACYLASSLQIPRVLVPLHPGVLSALGMLAADVVKDYSLTVMWPLETVTVEALREVFGSLEERGYREMRTEGLADEEVTAEYALDMRYAGQSYELVVALKELSPAEAGAGFHLAHESRFGYSNSGEPVEIVNLRLKMIGRVSKPALVESRLGPSDAAEAVVARKTVYFEETVGGHFGARSSLSTPIYDRAWLKPGHELSGPAIVVQMDATTAVPPGWSGRVDGWGNLVLEVA